jgi:hypothetical protein
MSTEKGDQPSCEEQLEEARQDLTHLEEENQRLRQAANTFGTLAERLNSDLQQERRLAAVDRAPRARCAEAPACHRLFPKDAWIKAVNKTPAEHGRSLTDAQTHPR